MSADENDGFLDRIIFSYPDSFPSQRWTERELSPEAESAWSDAIGRLFGQAMIAKDGRLLPYPVTFTPEGKSAWVAWFDRHAEEMEDPDFPERHAGSWSKMRAHAARFALILSRLRIACDPCPPAVGTAVPPVEAADVRGAVELVDYFKSQLARASHRMTAGIGSADAKAIVDWMKRHRMTRFRAAQVGEDLRRFRDEPAALAAALDVLKALGVIRPRPEVPEPGTPGPKPSPAYDAHPALLGAPEIPRDPTIRPSEPPDGSNSGINGNSWRSRENHVPPSDREVFVL
jgi:hypothetical protein